MSPEKAKVLYAEDSAYWQVIVRGVLGNAGHSVELVRTRAEALAMLSQIKEGRKKFDAIILGGELSGDRFSHEPVTSADNDSQLILAEMRKLEIYTPTIGLSGDLEPMPGVTVNIGKFAEGKEARLVETITKL